MTNALVGHSKRVCALSRRARRLPCSNPREVETGPAPRGELQAAGRARVAGVAMQEAPFWENVQRFARFFVPRCREGAAARLTSC